MVDDNFIFQLLYHVEINSSQKMCWLSNIYLKLNAHIDNAVLLTHFSVAIHKSSSSFADEEIQEEKVGNVSKIIKLKW